MGNPMQQARAALALQPRCGARCRRTGQPCRNPAMKNALRCRMHGGRAGRKPIHGRYAKAAIEEKRKIRALIRAVRALLAG
jgi:hypothetical protein